MNVCTVSIKMSVYRISLFWRAGRVDLAVRGERPVVHHNTKTGSRDEATAALTEYLSSV